MSLDHIPQNSRAKNCVSYSTILPPRVVRLRLDHLSLQAKRRERLAAEEA